MSKYSKDTALKIGDEIVPMLKGESFEQALARLAIPVAPRSPVDGVIPTGRAIMAVFDDLREREHAERDAGQRDADGGDAALLNERDHADDEDG